MKSEQKIYINMDDSGRLINTEPNELIFVYGGVYFLSLKEQENFSRQYKSLINLIKPKYCSNFRHYCLKSNCNTKNFQYCDNKCPELKSNMLQLTDKRRLLNLIKKQNTSVAIVSNHKIKNYIFDSKASKGRFKDYIIKREIKKIVENLICENKIDKNKPVKLIINLDEQSTVSNGYYNLESSIKEELQFGVTNFDYASNFPPILKSVIVNIQYKNSYYNLPIQAADLLVGEIRHAYYNYLYTHNIEEYKRRTNYLNTSIYLP